MIVINNLSKEFKSEDEERIEALQSINVTLPDKGLVVVTGESGCGKTTLLNIIGGFDKPTTGSVEYNGYDLLSLSNCEWDIIRAKEIGFIFQNYSLFEDMTVWENVALPLQMLGIGSEAVDDRISDIAKKTEIESILIKKVKHISGGQKQRVALARAVLKSPSLILADEPTGNLDEKNSEKVFDILKKYH